ncbi:MAG: hypothetical protein ACFFDT_25680, partial [Candidatus Hodarchaeota archaeon]
MIKSILLLSPPKHVVLHDFLPQLNLIREVISRKARTVDRDQTVDLDDRYFQSLIPTLPTRFSVD